MTLPTPVKTWDADVLKNTTVTFTGQTAWNYMFGPLLHAVKEALCDAGFTKPWRVFQANGYNGSWACGVPGDYVDRWDTVARLTDQRDSYDATEGSAFPWVVLEIEPTVGLTTTRMQMLIAVGGRFHGGTSWEPRIYVSPSGRFGTYGVADALCQVNTNGASGLHVTDASFGATWKASLDVTPRRLSFTLSGTLTDMPSKLVVSNGLTTEDVLIGGAACPGGTFWTVNEYPGTGTTVDVHTDAAGNGGVIDIGVAGTTGNDLAEALQVVSSTNGGPDVVVDSSTMDSAWVASLDSLPRKLVFVTGGNLGAAENFTQVIVSDGIATETVVLVATPGSASTTTNYYTGTNLTLTFSGGTGTNGKTKVGVGDCNSGTYPKAYGTTTQVPRAPDMFAVSWNTTGGNYGINGQQTVSEFGVLSTWVSPDGQITRWVFSHAGTPQCAFQLETLADFRTDWTVESNKVCAALQGYSVHTSMGSFLTAYYWTTRINNVARTLKTSYECFYLNGPNLSYPVAAIQGQDVDGWAVQEFGAYCNELGLRGRVGKFVDMWMAPQPYSQAAVVTSGDTTPPDGSRQFVFIGTSGVMWPWDTGAAPGAGTEFKMVP